MRRPRRVAHPIGSCQAGVSLVTVGSSGMKRKGRHHLPKVHDDLGPDDTARLFGRFRWSQYTPAGTVERAGFFARQAARTGTGEGWRWCLGAMVVVIPIVLGAALVIYALTLIF